MVLIWLHQLQLVRFLVSLVLNLIALIWGLSSLLGRWASCSSACSTCSVQVLCTETSRRPLGDRIYTAFQYSWVHVWGFHTEICGCSWTMMRLGTQLSYLRVKLLLISLNTPSLPVQPDLRSACLHVDAERWLGQDLMEKSLKTTVRRISVHTLASLEQIFGTFPESCKP